MVTRTKEAMFYTVSNDSKIVAADIEVRTGKKWKNSEELQFSEG